MTNRSWNSPQTCLVFICDSLFKTFQTFWIPSVEQRNPKSLIFYQFQNSGKTSNESLLVGLLIAKFKTIVCLQIQGFWTAKDGIFIVWFYCYILISCYLLNLLVFSVLHWLKMKNGIWNKPQNFLVEICSTHFRFFRIS